MATRPEDYTVGWICAISVEYVIACELLDEEYEESRAPSVHNQNLYTFGRIHQHHAVITCLAKGRYGTASAAIAAERMRMSFPAIRVNLMVGIAGGVPSPKSDIRLGDVVVSIPERKHPGVIQYDFGKHIQHEGFQGMGCLYAPSYDLLSAVQHLESLHKRRGSRIVEIIDKALLKNERLRTTYSLSPKYKDRLYHNSYVHEVCNCDCQVSYEQYDIDPSNDARLVSREPRIAQDPVLHYGLIASTNQLMKDAIMRDSLAEKHGILCFEMEAAGLINNFLVIRGISDYADTHKNDMWQGYAAATAAAYSKELIGVIPGPIHTNGQSTMKHDEQVLSSAVSSQQPSQASVNTDKFDIAFSLQRVPIAKRFVGREKEMQILKENLLPEVYNRRKLFVLRGMGGIGKTQLAVEFMRTHSNKFSAILWLNASSEFNLLKDLSSFVGKIRSGSAQNNHATNEADYKATAQEVLDWLSKPENSRWLLVYDNLDRGWNSSGLDSVARDIQQYLPTADHGSIIITTRLATLEQLGESCELKSVDNATAHGILRSWYKKDYDNVDGERLSECLGGLPLAIAQAGAYLQQSARSVKRYLQLYERKHTEFASLKQAWETPLLEYSDRCMWTTWTISFEAVREQNEHAANMLVLWSFLDRKDLWYGLFESAIGNTWKSDDKQMFMQALERWLGKAAFEESAFDNTMKLLCSYSLIEGCEQTEGYSMHPLVHRWTHLFHGERHFELSMLAFAVAGLAVPFSANPGCTRLQLRLLPHAQVYFTKAFSEPELFEGQIIKHMQSQFSRYIVKAIRRMGDLLLYNSKLDQAERIYKLAVRVAEEFLSENDELILDATYNLGNMYDDSGDLNKAQAMYTRALEGRRITFGEHHIQTLRAARSVASTLVKQNKFEDAEVIFDCTLERLVETVGIEHTTTLMTYDDIGLLYIKKGKLIEAEEKLNQALWGFEKVLGSDHVSTLETVHHLGILFTRKGNFAEAELQFEKVLLGYQSIFGISATESHTAALETMQSFGSLYAIQDRQLEAKLMFQRAWTGYRRLQGISSSKCCELEEKLAKLAADELPAHKENYDEAFVLLYA